MAAAIRIGTCSWADESLSKLFYPPGVKGAEERLRYYAERFDVVEANSTYYRLPDEHMVRHWAERTPEGFVMHVKAFGVMTRHPVKAEQLPPDLREGAPLDDRGRVDRPPREFRAEVFRRFHEALDPLRETRKLGGILMQLPPYVVFKPSSLEYLEWAQEQLGGDEMLVEFRHASWLDEENRRETLGFLERHHMTYVIVDAPRMEARNVSPTVVATTTPDRLHPLPRPQRLDLEQAHRQRGRALRPPLLRGRAGRVGRPAGRALRAGGQRLRDVQQQRPLDDAGPADPREPRRGGHGDRAGARERRDAAPAAAAREACRSPPLLPTSSIQSNGTLVATSSPAASTSTPSRARC